ncbi:hypothetical protein Tco_1240360, partial [Tanacetum coccineum]
MPRHESPMDMFLPEDVLTGGRTRNLINFENEWGMNGMHAGLSKYVPVNLKDIETAGFEEGEEVSLESLKEKGLINPSGRERRLPLK